MKFKAKPYEVEAVQFFPEDDCIEKIKELIGDNGVVVMDPDSPHFPTIFLGEKTDKGFIKRVAFIPNGFDWIVKDECFLDKYILLSDDEFRKRYEESK